MSWQFVDEFEPSTSWRFTPSLVSGTVRIKHVINNQLLVDSPTLQRPRFVVCIGDNPNGIITSTQELFDVAYGEHNVYHFQLLPNLGLDRLGFLSVRQNVFTYRVIVEELIGSKTLGLDEVLIRLNALQKDVDLIKQKMEI